MVYPPFESKVVVSSWLTRFGNALQEKNALAAADCFLQEGWLRESQIFTWDNRSLQGRDKVYEHISGPLPRRSFSNFQVDTRQYLAPERGQVGTQQEGVVSGFIFETDVQWGQGYAQLVQDEDNVWRALSVYMMAADIKGHEEAGRELGIYGNHTVSWGAVLDGRRKVNEETPQVLVIGASQTGVMVAARFKQMNIPTLVIEAQSRLGDTWRKRYDSLTLHTPRMHDHFLYQRYPQNWPLHTPKEKLADWIESYANCQDLTVWLNSKPVDGSIPIYDGDAKRWTITIDRAGQHVTLFPAHIVLCIGTVGTRIVPHVKNQDVFKGTVIHGADYKSPVPFTNKRVVVVGAGNTAGDICLDLSVCADTITMVQRSKSTLVPVEVVRTILTRFWPDDGSVPTEVADFKFSSAPLNLLRQLSRLNKAGGGGSGGRYAELYRGLREKGMIVDDGEDGEGIAFQVLERFGGFMLDVGCSRLVLSGRVNVKHGVEVACLKEDAVVFTDGSEVPADVVIFATGYKSAHENFMKIFGKETIDRTGKHFWGLDEEGELRNVFRPTGHPALWFCAGGYQVVRFGSKQLAMQIKATDLGLRDL